MTSIRCAWWTAPARWFLNSSFTEPADNRRRQGRPELLIRAEDLGAIGALDGARVRIGNAQGSLVLHARVFDGLQRGVVVVESLWPNAAFEEGVGINLLVGADSPPPNGGAAFHDTAIWARPA